MNYAYSLNLFSDILLSFGFLYINVISDCLKFYIISLLYNLFNTIIQEFFYDRLLLWGHILPYRKGVLRALFARRRPLLIFFKSILRALCYNLLDYSLLLVKFVISVRLVFFDFFSSYSRIFCL